MHIKFESDHFVSDMKDLHIAIVRIKCTIVPLLSIVSSISRINHKRMYSKEKKSQKSPFISIEYNFF